MMIYQLIPNFDGIKRIEDGKETTIPRTHGGLYREYLAWLEAGNEPLPADEPPLEQVKAQAMDQLNAGRGAARARLGLTRAEFQELVYSGKMQMALRWLDQGDDNAPFPFSLEAQARGITNRQMAELIVQQGSMWLAGSDAIEATYIGGAAAITGAADAEAVEAALAGVEWPV